MYVVWCGVVWCGVVWCGVVWCGVVCRVMSCSTTSNCYATLRCHHEAALVPSKVLKRHTPLAVLDRIYVGCVSPTCRVVRVD